MGLQWWGIQERTALREDIVAYADAIADAAHDGRWDRLVSLLGGGPQEFDEWPTRSNSTRVGGSSGYAPLHQLAWHGGPVSVAEQLVAVGAWRTLRCATGQTPADIAAERGHKHLLEVLTPQPRHAVPPPRLAQLEHVLHAVIDSRAYDLVHKARQRLPQLGPLTEATEPAMWMAVPRMYGGFSIKLTQPGDVPELTVESWCRVVGGSGQRHVVRPNGFELVDEGFV
ncbi:hypothetical protein ACFXHA_14425 [Nocardia sp. NPDC059240]|uniref:hypothetical protein n=1 Tax=Nocardia sp. NPDC059240 TaxID=3346786 RepID=UPI0036A132B4